ncbi:O-antigen ligase family protein [Candidatus Kuenenbacteria bacterium]|nr:O-antigen ligase family protein [Candidatus Kuenenbacteria bacterium]
MLISGAHEKIISLYWLGRFLLGAGLFGAVQQIEFSKLKLALVVAVTGFIQGLLAIWQFANQSIWSNKWLGMASQKASELGASVIEIGGDRYLRAYGSWPHPNILGGFLILILGAWFYLLTQAKERQQKRFVILTGIGIAAGIFFSFSRASWLIFLTLYAWAWFYVSRYRREKFDKKILSAIGLVVVVLTVLFAPLVETRMGVGERQRLEIRSEEERLSGYGQAIEIIKNNWWGVGMGNYAFTMRDYYKIDDPWEIQPVHNTYLMIWAELGAVGFLLVILLNCYIIKLLIKRKGWWNLGILMIIYGLMLFDHFWWTTASGMYIWWLAAGLGYKERELRIKI